MNDGPLGDAQVPAFWRELGIPGLADIHVHFLPPRLMRRAWAGFAACGPLLGTTWPVIYRWSDEERVAHLTSMGVRAFTALAYADQPGIAADLNAWTLDFAERTPGCIPSITVFPETGVNTYTRAALEAGARVVKVHPHIGDFSPTHARLDSVWGMISDAGVPVVIHAGSSLLSDDRGGVESFAGVLRRHPRLTAVIAHLGAPDYAESLALATRYERVCLDTSMALTGFFENLAPFPRAHLPALRELGLAGRILLGTNFPNLPYAYAEQLRALANLDLGDDWLRAVCWDNAATLLDLR